MELLAYHHYLLKRSGRNRTLLAELLLNEAMSQNIMAFALLEKTGDENYTQETFLKAADLLLDKENK